MTRLQDILRSAADRLRSTSIPPKFILKERLSGALLDLNALRGRGWRLLTTLKDGGPDLWAQSAWLERTVEAGEAGSYLVHAAFGLNAEDIAAAFARKAPFPAFLRRVHVFRWTEGGLSYDIPEPPPPPEAFRQIELELGEAVLEERPALLADMEHLAEGYDVVLPPGVWPSPFARHLAIVQQMAADESKDGRVDGAERLLAPVFAVLAHPGSDPEAERELLESTDGNTLWRILFVWLSVADDDAVVRPYVSFLIDRQLSGELGEPLNAHGWSVLAATLMSLGEGPAGLAAFEKAIELGEDAPEFLQSLWNHVLRFANELGLRPAGDPPDGLRDLIRFLVAHEDALAAMHGYWSLLGLAFLLNGEKNTLVMDRLKKALPSQPEQPEDQSPESKVQSAESEVQSPKSEVGEPDVETSDSETSDTPTTTRFVTHPLEWQSFLIGVYHDNDAASRQLAVFPTPLLASPADPREFPVEPLSGASPGDMWQGLDPDIANRFSSIVDDILATGHSIGEASLGRPSITGLEISDENGYIVTDLFKPPANRCELTGLLAVGQRVGGPPHDDSVPFRLIPLARPSGTPKNTALSVWHLHPWTDNGCGEARMRLPDGHPLHAILPFFATDRHLIPRGVPCPAFVHAIGITAGVCLDAASIGRDDARPLCMLNPIDVPFTKSLHGCIALVRSVHRVRLRGAESTPILRLDLDLGSALPFLLPLYIHASVFQKTGGKPRRGDLIQAQFLLQADLFTPEPAAFRAWRRDHPDDPGPEPEATPPYVENVLHSFHKYTKEELDEQRRMAKEMGDEDVIDDKEPLSPDNLDTVRAALEKLRKDLGPDNCRVWSDNPSRTDIAARVGGTVHRYRVFKLRDAEPFASSGELAPGIEPLVVRVTDCGDHYDVAYEGFP